MATRGPQPVWRAVGQSVRGATHVRAALPNQDAWRCLPASAEGPPLIVAVSDGHGSARSFRSHLGSAQAVDIAVGVLRELLEGQPQPLNLSAVKRTAEERLPGEIVRRWQEAVDQDRREHPFTEAELQAVTQKHGPKAAKDLEENPRLAYGATLLVVLVAESFILYLQLGDGDILTVSERGEVTRPLPDDTRLFADQTTSLCIPEAWRDFRIRFQGLTGAPPALILLSTDGYANSFVNEAAFLQVGGDIWDLLRAQGLEQVQASLVGWLTEASEKGSGDDITLALLCRTELLPAPEELAAQAALAESPVAPEEPPAPDESVAPPGNRRLWYDAPDFDEGSSASGCSETP
ncbi:MAG: protein phosphatase 2C domain-containing protein [Chloroflexi bacterium]|nr:protein phosphatase 2C domain-containing protein [Chloroflexota bacterium]OQB01382.1 MAG: hypothetical protein BWY25_01181 [Chloroflexi bacterium ADurb.Bin222]HOS79546.1 PP2C family serine/threonine-protein phosphatase [Anaerolineae bacterium]HQJ11533.1 PP2C family serine/threonine-protein phosphatase [Anaerolineae bacterium]HUM37885.1 PP2C family serine/threonine-protein phosphatase [Anaerolineae bacterium]